MALTVARMGARGTVVLPSHVRRQLGLGDGDLLILEVSEGRVVLRPAVALPAEECPPERRAEFILNSAINPDDYLRARRAVEKMGLDPDRIPHDPPPGAARTPPSLP